MSRLSCENQFLSLTLSVYSAGQIEGHTCPPSFLTHLYLQVYQSSEKLSHYPHILTFSHWLIIPSPHHNFIDQLFCPIFAPASETHPIVLNVIYNTICFEGAVNNSMVTSIVLYAIRWLVLIEDGWMWFGWIFVFLWDWDEAAVGHWALSEKITKKNSNSELLRFFKWTFPLLLWYITGDAHVNKEFKSTFLVVYRLNVCPTPHTFQKQCAWTYLDILIVDN